MRWIVETIEVMVLVLGSCVDVNCPHWGQYKMLVVDMAVFGEIVWIRRQCDRLARREVDVFGAIPR